MIYLQSFLLILLLCLSPFFGNAQPEHLLPQREIFLPKRVIDKCVRGIKYDKNMSLEIVDKVLSDQNDNDTCAILLIEKKMLNDWVDVGRYDGGERRDRQWSYFDYWTKLLKESSLMSGFKDYILNEFYCTRYWRSQVEHKATTDMCNELLYINGTQLVEAAYFRAKLLDEQLKHMYRVHGCSDEYVAGLWYLVNLREFLYIKNTYGSQPIMELKGQSIFYNASIRVGECKGFTKEVFEIFNLGGDVKHLFVKEKDE